MSDHSEGLVLRVAGSWAKLLIEKQEVMVAIPGKWRLTTQGSTPLAPGDRVIVKQERDSYKIVELLPRKNHFTRRAAGPKPIPQTIAANLDFAVIVASLHQPTTPPGLIDRLLVTASAGNLTSVLLINKTDLEERGEREKWKRLYHRIIPLILFTSALTGEGVDQLKELIMGKTVLLVGASGVGKSTLANRIHPSLNLRTREVSPATSKGRHTTTAAQLHPIPGGGWITDTPGLRECAPWGITPQTLQLHFPEIRHLASFCQFRNCLHQREEGCAVIAAAGTADLPAERYYSYLKMLAELKEPRKVQS